VVVLPLYWMLKAAVSTPDDLFKLPPEYLPRPSGANLAQLASQLPLVDYVLNSVLFSTMTALVTVAVGFLAAYGFARFSFPGRDLLLWGFILSMALPAIATIIPLYRVLAGLGLLDSLLGLTLVMSSALAPFTVWILVAFIQQVPREIEESAMVDGARLGQVLWRIVVPVTLPALATMVVIDFITAWNELLYPLAFSGSPASKTLSVAITEIYQTRAPWGRPWNLVATLGTVMVAPCVLLVLVSQRAIVRGLTRGAVR
jgi:ABC-type glycerol-3-phosphate transport system permease component